MKKRIKSIFKRSTAAALSAAMVFSLGVSSVPAIVLAQDSETGTELQNDSQEVKIELGEISSMSAKSYGPATDGDTLEASFDGDTTTYTNSNYNDAANSKPQVYTFNFAEEVNLCKVRIHPRNTGGHVGNGAPNSCIVEVSTDGNSYTQVASQAVNDTALVWTDITFAATPAKSVRLTLDSAHATVVTTGEVELYKEVTQAAGADKTELQNLYDEASAAEFTYEDSSLKAKLTDALTDAKTVLDDADATQEDVDSAYYYLEKHYWQNKVYDKKEYYNPEKAGEDGRFVYSDKVTESILPLAAAYQETRNVNGNTEIDKLREYYDILTAADAAQADVITAEPDQRSTEIGFNTQDDSYINYALDPQNYGHFNITGQEFVLDDNGEVSVKVTFEFVNDGKHPVTGAEGSKYSSSEMRNPGCRVVYGDGTTQKGSKGVSNIAALNGNYSNGITGEFTVSQDSVISLYLKDSVMAGYFKVQKFTPADKTALKEKTDEAAAIIEEEYKYNHNDKWDAFLESYEAAQDVYDNPLATDTEVNDARVDLTNKIFDLRFETEKPEAVFVINGEEKEITADALLNSEFDLKFTDNGKLTQFVLNGTESALDGTEDTAAFAEIEALLNEGNGEDGKNTLIVRDSVVTDGIYWNENTYTFYFDQTAPVLGEPEYIENEDGSVTVKIDVDELDQNRLPEGWTYEDGAVIKNFTESAEEEVVLYDAAGNASSAAVKVAITEDPENPEDPDPEDPQKPGTGDADKPSTGKPSDTQKPDGNSGNAQKAVVTGDESSPVLWIVVLAAACVVVGVIVVIKKKK
ncbi:MAG TPA: discoidin domain-containing protein [Candidatus Mediterraneibacter stercorigallinarum]|uniref:Discoidin domain-containing protein n=1 Tax=Candidatus Mediterraneibacter stercorigallinarum TaxID=2838686 RepID=A0A9D2IJU7_9FIRM|nr:discoidin domain-containing protein [Candidatus Mediterraneibacter stercorigallinarum]